MHSSPSHRYQAAITKRYHDHNDADQVPNACSISCVLHFNTPPPDGAACSELSRCMEPCGSIRREGWREGEDRVARGTSPSSLQLLTFGVARRPALPSVMPSRRPVPPRPVTSRSHPAAPNIFHLRATSRKQQETSLAVMSLRSGPRAPSDCFEGMTHS